jgi:hypothetical protein
MTKDESTRKLTKLNQIMNQTDADRNDLQAGRGKSLHHDPVGAHNFGLASFGG